MPVGSTLTLYQVLIAEVDGWKLNLFVLLGRKKRQETEETEASAHDFHVVGGGVAQPHFLTTQHLLSSLLDNASSTHAASSVCLLTELIRHCRACRSTSLCEEPELVVPLLQDQDDLRRSGDTCGSDFNLRSTATRMSGTLQA